jgi:hypothetical protein
MIGNVTTLLACLLLVAVYYINLYRYAKLKCGFLWRCDIDIGGRMNLKNHATIEVLRPVCLDNSRLVGAPGRKVEGT